MARLSDVIEEFIKDMLQNTEDRKLQIQRNELANKFRCAPSQINYVLTTRFTTEKGYYVESKRGGGGCILIRHSQFNKNETLFNVISEKIGDSITASSANRIIETLLESSFITEREYNIVKVAINDRTLADAKENKNKIRAHILKNMIFMLLL